MYFTPVDINKLEPVLEFLVDGFGWSLKRQKQIREYIQKANKSIGIYGYAMYDNIDCISSAILLPYQGFSKKYKIISLMAWYSKKSCRGINSILFAEKLYKFLISNEFIITDYTPSKTVSLILQKLNFKSMNGFRKKDLIILKPHKLLCSFMSNKNSRILETKSENFPFKKFKVTNYADTDFITLDTIKKQTSFCCISRIVKKKIIGLKVSLPTVHIIWSEDQKHLIENWNILCFLLFKKYKSVCIIADFESSFSANNELYFEINQLNYLISSDNKDVKFIPPLGSELCLSNKNL